MKLYINRVNSSYKVGEDLDSITFREVPSVEKGNLLIADSVFAIVDKEEVYEVISGGRITSVDSMEEVKLFCPNILLEGIKQDIVDPRVIEELVGAAEQTEISELYRQKTASSLVDDIYNERSGTLKLIDNDKSRIELMLNNESMLALYDDRTLLINDMAIIAQVFYQDIQASTLDKLVDSIVNGSYDLSDYLNKYTTLGLTVEYLSNEVVKINGSEEVTFSNNSEVYLNPAILLTTTEKAKAKAKKRGAFLVYKTSGAVGFVNEHKSLNDKNVVELVVDHVDGDLHNYSSSYIDIFYDSSKDIIFLQRAKSKKLTNNSKEGIVLSNGVYNDGLFVGKDGQVVDTFLINDSTYIADVGERFRVNSKESIFWFKGDGFVSNTGDRFFKYESENPIDERNHKCVLEYTKGERDELFLADTLIDTIKEDPSILDVNDGSNTIAIINGNTVEMSSFPIKRFTEVNFSDDMVIYSNNSRLTIKDGEYLYETNKSRVMRNLAVGKKADGTLELVIGVKCKNYIVKLDSTVTDVQTGVSNMVPNAYDILEELLVNGDLSRIKQLIDSIDSLVSYDSIYGNSYSNETKDWFLVESDIIPPSFDNTTGICVVYMKDKWRIKKFDKVQQARAYSRMLCAKRITKAIFIMDKNNTIAMRDGKIYDKNSIRAVMGDTVIVLKSRDGHTIINTSDCDSVSAFDSYCCEMFIRDNNSENEKAVLDLYRRLAWVN